MRTVVCNLVADCRAASLALSGELRPAADAKPFPRKPNGSTVQALNSLLRNPPKQTPGLSFGDEHFTDYGFHGWFRKYHASNVTASPYDFLLLILRSVVLLPKFLILLTFLLCSFNFSIILSFNPDVAD